VAFHLEKGHSRDQLKNFNNIVKVKIVTGDPTMPPDVREAKEI
jgi:hypothetical protein